MRYIHYLLAQHIIGTYFFFLSSTNSLINHMVMRTATKVSKFVELSVAFSVVLNSTLNETLNSTINDTEFKKKILFHLDYYFF